VETKNTCNYRTTHGRNLEMFLFAGCWTIITILPNADVGRKVDFVRRLTDVSILLEQIKMDGWMKCSDRL